PTDVNGTIFYADAGNGVGRELWKTGATPGAPQLVADAIPGPVGINPGRLLNVGGTLFFIGSTPDPFTFTLQLWKTDGTAAGTVRVTDKVDLHEPGWMEQRLVEFGGAVYFRGADADGDIELWRSDGTDAGTVRVADI